MVNKVADTLAKRPEAVTARLPPAYTMTRTICAVFCLIAVLLLAACRRSADSVGGEAYDKAKRQYDALVLGARTAQDPGYDEVLRLLEQVPAESSYREKADRLRTAIENVRRPRVVRPLATSGRGFDGGMAQLRDTCAELARQYGIARTEEERAALKQDVLECQRAVDRIREERHHQASPNEPDHGE